MRSGGDIAVVPKLIRIGDREDQGRTFGCLVTVANDDVLRLRGTPRGQSRANVSLESTFSQLRKSIRDLGIETQAHDIEEGPSIRFAGINNTDATLKQRIECELIRLRNTEVAPQSVAGTAGDQAEGGLSVDETSSHFVDGAITTDGYHGLATFSDGLPSQLGGVQRSLRGDDDGIELLLLNEGARAIQEARIPEIVAGVGIKNEAQFQSRGNARRTRSEAARVERGRTILITCLHVGGRCTQLLFVMPKRQTIHLLTGCTAVGKTELALRWAEDNDAEIVSCDSLLFYRGMDIGTAKPTQEERARVPHHLIDICEPGERMDIARYVKMARETVSEILTRGRRVLVTGGSGFYLKAFLAPVVDGINVSEDIRERVETMSLPDAVTLLKELNPDGLGTLDRDNPRRVTRALERCLASGKSLLQLRADFAAQPSAFADYEIKLVELVRDAEILTDRISQRVDAMLSAGLVTEVENLLSKNMKVNPSAALSIGYREVIAMLAGELPPESLAEKIAQNTRALVKKQRTWFRTQIPEHLTIDAATAKPAELFPEV